MIAPDLRNLGPTPTVTAVALFLREKFKRSHAESVWLTYVSPLDVVAAAKARGVRLSEGRLVHAGDVSSIYFELSARAEDHL